eukprot:scaffold37983_cov52-Cyclotella_meneghiniana.AAC.2
MLISLKLGVQTKRESKNGLMEVNLMSKLTIFPYSYFFTIQEIVGYHYTPDEPLQNWASGLMAVKRQSPHLRKGLHLP